MLDGLFMLLTLSTIMAIASFLAGSLPLYFSLSQSRLRLVATIGMGVLVGTALIVIIPEGVETLYSASDYDGEGHTRRSTPLDGASMLRRAMSLPGNAEEVPWPRILRDAKGEEKEKDKATPIDFSAPPGIVIPADSEAVAESDAESGTSATSPPKTPTEPGKVGILEQEEIKTPSTVNKPPRPKTSSIPEDPPTQKTPSKVAPVPESKSEREPHAWIGLSLILGFILMYLLDTLPLVAPSTPQRPHSNIYSLSDLSSSPVFSPAPPQRSLSTTLGLCIHAAADGVALGASSSSSSTSSLSFIIFVAIMVHKAPAAFGLTSVLLKQGLGKRSARAHLLIFSLAAPGGAIATWILVRALGGGTESEPAIMKWWTGILLLFSGGTFLYVAMHTMNEEESSSGMLDEAQSNGYLEAGSGRPTRRGKEGKSPKMMMAAVGGMLLPLITQIGHVH